MARKRWSRNPDESAESILGREKRKWQIAFRRYVLEKMPSPFYAPYFGLDVNHLRLWLENQFTPDLRWRDFGKTWQFEHIVPVSYFDFTNNEELKLCWNFLNIRIRLLDTKQKGHSADLTSAIKYYQEIFKNTGYGPAGEMLQKIKIIEESEIPRPESQISFLKEHSNHLTTLSTYGSFEFELLNNGRSGGEIEEEARFLRKFDK